MRLKSLPLLAAATAVTLSTATLSGQIMTEPRAASYGVNVVLPAPLPASDENIRSLHLPPDFKIEKFAEGLKQPRVIVVSAAGNVYVSSRDAGTITLITPDGAQKQVLGLENVHGMVIHDNVLFYVTIKEVYSAPILPDGTLGTSKLIISDLPDAGQHPDRTLAVGPDNKLYESVGSTCNTCAEKNPDNATMQRSNLDGTGRETFAKGLRNTIGFAFQPGTGNLYGWDDGADWLGDKEQREELNLIQQGKQYGWPYILGNGIHDVYLDPPRGITLDDWDKMSMRPALTYTAHASGMQLLFLNGTGLPSGYGGDALATMHGSWGANPPTGYEVVRVHFDHGTPKTIEPWITGFVKPASSPSGYGRFGRIMGLAQMKDGSILIGDEQNGIIYRVRNAR